MEEHIDFDRLREDLKIQLEAAYFGGGFGGAMVDRGRLDYCSIATLCEIALQYGINPEDYRTRSKGPRRGR